MAIKTITLSPTAFLIRDEPFGALVWSPTTGGGSMLSTPDSDNANCVNSTGLAQDSDALDARSFKVAGAFPVFESDARAPSLKVFCYMKANDSVNAQPTVFIFDTGDFSKLHQMQPYATVNAAAWYQRTSTFPNLTDVFACMAAGRFAVSCIFPSRPTEASYPCASFNWDAVYVELTYTYGPNTTPDLFNFQNKVGNASAVVLSDLLTITGIDTPQAVTISGDATAQFSINGGAFGTTGNIAAGQTLQLRMTASATVGQVRTCTVTVETRADVWNVTTGTDVPVNLNPPANRTNYIPAFWIPNVGVIAGSSISWSPNGNTIPMPFHFAASPWPVQYSVGAVNGPWTDGTEPGQTLGSAIYIRLKTPPGPDQTATVRLTYASTNLTSDVTISTGPEATIYSVDLSPIDAFQSNAVSGGLTWAPVVSGAARHVSVATPASRGTGVAFQSYYTNLDAGRWLRLGDGAPMEWPPGTKITGVGYGGKRSSFNSGAVAASVVYGYYIRDPGGTFRGAGLTDSGSINAGPVVVMLGASPGVIPTGYTADTLLSAIKGDTIAISRLCQCIDSTGRTLYGDSYDLRLRVFFQVVKPPHGVITEI